MSTVSVQFIRGVNESIEPEIDITRSKDGTTGTALFTFLNPNSIVLSENEDIKGMFLIDSEGVIVTRNINLEFQIGRPTTLKALVIMKNRTSWDRFIRFLKRYSFEHNLNYAKLIRFSE